MTAASLTLPHAWQPPSLPPLRAIKPPMETASADSTQQLLHRIRAGDDAARERLLARYLPMLPYGYAALDRAWAHLESGTTKPADAEIATTPRATGTPLTAANLNLP